MRSPRLATWFLLALAGMAIVETVAAGVVYRSRIDADDWHAIEAALDDETPVFVDPPWLEPVARHYLAAARTDVSVGAPDLHGQRRLALLTPADHARASHHMQADLDERGPATTSERQTFGGLALTTLAFDDALVELDALRLRDDLELTAVTSTRRETCRRRGSSWTCGSKDRELVTATRRPLEIDFRARHCLAIDFHRAATLSVHVPDMQLGERLRGHVGVADFNARLRSDAPVALRVEIDETLTLQRTFADDEGWAAFEIETTPSRADVTVHLTRPDVAAWQRGRMTSSDRAQVCVELRSLGAAR